MFLQTDYKSFIKSINATDKDKSKDNYNNILIQKALFNELNDNYEESTKLFKLFLNKNYSISSKIKAEAYVHIAFNYFQLGRIEEAKKYLLNTYDLIELETDTYKVAKGIDMLIKNYEEKYIELEKIKKELTENDKIDIQKHIQYMNRLFSTGDYEELKSYTKNFIEMYSDKIKYDTSDEDEWRVSVSAAHFYYGKIHEEIGGKENKQIAMDNYRATINIGRNPDIKINKVVDAYTRIQLNEAIYGTEKTGKEMEIDISILESAE